MIMKSKSMYVMMVAAMMLTTACRPEQDTRIDVMTFNIRLNTPSDSLNSWPYRVDNVSAMVRYYEPDVIGTQEVLPIQFADLKKVLADYTALGVGREDGKEKGERCALFYKTNRFELIDNGDFALSENPDNIGPKGWDAACPRVATWAILKDKDSGKQFFALNTHLDHIGQVARSEGAKLLVERMKTIANGMPAVLTGDFNSNPDSEPIQILIGSDLQYTAQTSPVKYGPSWSFHDFGRRPIEKRSLIDYIFTSPNFQALKYRVIADKPDNGYISDHCPVMSTLLLK